MFVGTIILSCAKLYFYTYNLNLVFSHTRVLEQWISLLLFGYVQTLEFLTDNTEHANIGKPTIPSFNTLVRLTIYLSTLVCIFPFFPLNMIDGLCLGRNSWASLGSSFKYKRFQSPDIEIFGKKNLYYILYFFLYVIIFFHRLMVVCDFIAIFYFFHQK